jgi:hypothetical protein
LWARPWLTSAHGIAISTVYDVSLSSALPSVPRTCTPERTSGVEVDVAEGPGLPRGVVARVKHAVLRGDTWNSK